MEAFQHVSSCSLWPDEVLQGVAAKLNKKDFVSLLNSSENAHDALSGQRTRRLFGTVFKAFQYEVPKSFVLKCREICSVTKAVADNFYEDHPDRIFEDGLTFPTDASAVPIKDYGMLFKKLENYVDFMVDMRNNHGNPFPGRSVLFRITSNDTYVLGLLPLLERFGTEIWYVALIIPRRINNHVLNQENIEVFVGNSLRLMPNLQVALFDIRGYDVEDDAAEMDARIVAYFRDNSVVLPQLQHVGFARFSPPSLVSSVLRFCCSADWIVQLNIFNFHWNPEYRFPNVEILLCIVSLEQLPQLVAVSPRMTSFSMRTHPDNETIGFQTLFSVLEPLSNRLSVLCLYFETAMLDWRGCEPDWRLNFPCLHYLLMRYDGPLMYLETLTSLKELVLVNRAPPNEENGDYFKTAGLVIPSLEKFTEHRRHVDVFMVRDHVSGLMLIDQLEEHDPGDGAYFHPMRFTFFDI